MSQKSHQECFGKMFPDDLHLKSNQPNKGKVFTRISELETILGYSQCRFEAVKTGVC